MPDTAKGLLTAGNSLIAFMDMRAPVPGHLSMPLQNSLMLAQVALLLGVPQLHSSVACAAALMPGRAAMVRTSMSAWDDRGFNDAVHATGCGKLILAGLGTATFVALPALQATHDGYEVYVVEDCCSDASQMAHDNGMQRMIQAGVRPLTAMALMLEWQRDRASIAMSRAMADIARAHMGPMPLVDYALMAVHEERWPVYPGFVAPASR